MAWKKITVNVQNVKTETKKAVLIAMPHSSDYDGFKFWVSKNMVHPGNNSFEVVVSFPDNWVFRLFKNGGGKYNSRDIVAEDKIDAETMIDQW